MAIAVAPQCKLAGKESDSVISYAALNRSSFKMFDQVSASNHVECFYGHPPVRQPPSGYKISSFPYVTCNFKGKFCVNASRSPDETADEKGNIKNDDQQLHSTEPNLQSCKEDSELEASHFRLIENEKHGYSDGEIQKQRKKSELEEIGQSIVQFMRPFIKFLNGSSLNQLNREGLPSRRNNILLTFSNAFVRTVSGLAWTDSRQYEIGNMFRKAEADFFKCTNYVGRYLLTMMSTGAILAIAFELSGGDSELNTLIWSSWLAGVIVGTMIGANSVLEHHCKSGPRNIVITGSTRGLGKALAREFLLAGDRVVIASRSPKSVSTTVAQLQQEITEGIFTSKVDTPKTRNRKGKVVGISCDVSKIEDVKLLADFAVGELGSIDIWINNAGMNKGFRPLLQFTDEEINQVVSTNLIGSLICTREAIRVMKMQPKGGHIFNMDGAGSGGSSTPLTAVYGSTKCGLRQLHASLLEECKRSKVGIHTASPGMVLTDLLISGASLQNKKMFNIICELPETVARKLVPRMRTVKGTGKAINYLTPPRILLALVTAWLRRGRWFDEEGRALYAAEADRVRNWAEGRTRFSFTDAMDFYSDSTWVSVFSLSVVCAFIILSSSVNSMSGT